MTYGVGLGGVEVGADDAVFFHFAEDELRVGVGEGGRHFEFRSGGNVALVESWLGEDGFCKCKGKKKILVEVI